MDLDLSHLPSSWRAEPLGEAAEFTRKPPGLPLTSTVRFVPMDLIPTTGIYARRSETRLVEDLTSGTYVEDGDVMVAKITPCFENGKQGILRIGSSFAYATTEVIPLHGKHAKSDTLFLHFLLLHPGLRANLASQMEGSTNRQRLAKHVLEKALVPVPPLDEQRRITAVLSALQRTIEHQERLIALTAELKKALMQKLFTEGTRREPLKHTEIGPVPESWDILRFGDLAEFKNGINFTRDQKGASGVLTIDVLNMYGQGCEISLEKLYRVNKQLTGEYYLRSGDLLFVRSSVKLEGVGWASMFSGASVPVTFCGFIIRARLNGSRTIDPQFLIYYFRSEGARRRFVASGTKVAITNINQGLLSGMHVPCPSADEQARLVDLFSAIEQLENVYQRRLVLLNRVFGTLVHQLMTAQLRVNDLDVAALHVGEAAGPA